MLKNQPTNKQTKKKNKTVATYASLHYCQCDIGRKQNEKQTEQPI